MNALTAEHGVLDALAHGRYSCRAFRPDPVPRERLEAVFRTAQRAASWCNAQPWQVTVASGETLARLRTALAQRLADPTPPQPDLPWPTAYEGVYQQRRRECGLGLYDAVGIARGDREASARQAALNYTMFGAPHVAVITSDAALGVYGAVDCGAYVSQCLLAAHSLGLGSIAQAALAAYPEVLRGVLGLPPGRPVVCALSLGWPDTDHPANRFRTGRAALDDAVQWCD